MCRQLPQFAVWALCCEFFEELNCGGSSDLFQEGDRAAGDDFQFDFRIFGDKDFSQASATLVFFLGDSLGCWLEFRQGPDRSQSFPDNFHGTVFRIG